MAKEQADTDRSAVLPPNADAREMGEGGVIEQAPEAKGDVLVFGILNLPQSAPGREGVCACRFLDSCSIALAELVKSLD